MYHFIILFIVYILTIPLISHNYMSIIRVAILSLLLIAFNKSYRFRLKFGAFPVFIGFVIFLSWILLEGFYPIFGNTVYIPANNLLLFFRVFSFIILAPIIEEFFVRNFLARILVSEKWKKVPLGKFTPTSFVITVAFFGFSHNRWLPGLIAGILLNYLIYKKRSMGSVILAHATANILLAFYIIYTKSWFFW